MLNSNEKFLEELNVLASQGKIRSVPKEEALMLFERMDRELEQSNFQARLNEIGSEISSKDRFYL